ncbi:MAG TPA: hypothetical protein VJK53_01205 [Candidatus Paceibacterota bacterium]
MNTTLTIKTDKKLRDEVKKTAKQMGIPITIAMNAMMRQFVRDGVLTLEAECPYPSHAPNAETRKALREAMDPKNIAKMKSYANADEMFDAILGKNWRVKSKAVGA